MLVCLGQVMKVEALNEAGYFTGDLIFFTVCSAYILLIMAWSFQRSKAKISFKVREAYKKNS